MPLVVKSFIITLQYYRERYDSDFNPLRNGMIYNVANEIVYWYKSVRGYETALNDQESSQLIKFMKTFPNIYDVNRIDILDENDGSIQWDNTVYAIPLNQFIIEITECDLPFEVLGRRALVV